MHKPFYASGFLYHSASQQILLQQFKSSSGVKLTLFRGEGRKANDPQVVFQHTVEEALGVRVPASSIHPVYDYVHDRLGEHFIFYVEVASVRPRTYSSKNKTEWCLLSKLSKHIMSEQTRHDIIIGERVIRSRLEPAHVPLPPNRH